MPPKAAPIPQDTMANKLAFTPLSEQDAHALLRSETWDEFRLPKCSIRLPRGIWSDRLRRSPRFRSPRMYF
jgi:hypothetical protein